MYDVDVVKEVQLEVALPPTSAGGSEVVVLFGLARPIGPVLLVLI